MPTPGGLRRERLVLRRRLALGRLRVDGRRPLLVEGGEVVVGPLARQVALATLDEAPEAGALLAQLVGTLLLGVPPDAGHVVDGLPVVRLEVRPAVVLTERDRRGREEVGRRLEPEERVGERLARE